MRRPTIEQAAILRGIASRAHYSEDELSGGNIRSLNVMCKKGWVEIENGPTRIWRITELGKKIRNSLDEEG